MGVCQCVGIGRRHQIAAVHSQFLLTKTRCSISSSIIFSLHLSSSSLLSSLLDFACPLERETVCQLIRSRPGRSVGWRWVLCAEGRKEGSREIGQKRGKPLRGSERTTKSQPAFAISLLFLFSSSPLCLLCKSLQRLLQHGGRGHDDC